MDPRTLDWYNANAPAVVDAYEAADPHRFHDFLAPLCPAGARVLDVGCGSGREVAWLQKTGALAWGVDASAAMVQEAYRRARKNTG
ncbi:MAG: class I SAM-dependent methyltransferase [Planctomycetes bacterium]|nr:class I SAM-dependent methyltransferase [Planctomycetota bacterium]